MLTRGTRLVHLNLASESTLARTPEHKQLAKHPGSVLTKKMSRKHLELHSIRINNLLADMAQLIRITVQFRDFTSQQILRYTGMVSHPSCPLSEEHKEV